MAQEPKTSQGYPKEHRPSELKEEFIRPEWLRSQVEYSLGSHFIAGFFVFVKNSNEEVIGHCVCEIVCETA